MRCFCCFSYLLFLGFSWPRPGRGRGSWCTTTPLDALGFRVRTFLRFPGGQVTGQMSCRLTPTQSDQTVVWSSCAMLTDSFFVHPCLLPYFWLMVGREVDGQCVFLCMFISMFSIDGRM